MLQWCALALPVPQENGPAKLRHIHFVLMLALESHYNQSEDNIIGHDWIK